jgi:hypothetical protein
MKLDFPFFSKNKSNFKKLNFKPVSSFEAVKNLSTTEKLLQMWSILLSIFTWFSGRIQKSKQLK